MTTKPLVKIWNRIEVASQPRDDRLVIQHALHGLAAARERGLFERASETQTFADLEVCAAVEVVNGEFRLVAEGRVSQA